jgi:Uma2 family endonuclease
MAIDAREQPAAGHVVLTYEDDCALPDDGKRHEILRGGLYISPSPSVAHQRVACNLFVALRIFVAGRKIGEVFIAPVDVILETTAVVVPDLLFVGRDRASIVTDRGVEGAPDLIVEILSPGPERRDRVEEAQLFARHGVTHYWLVDPEARALEAFELDQGGYRRTARLTGAADFVPTLFAGLTIQLASLWS